ncbi:MAG: hypothetical protein PHW41_03720, partial [Eubacteriales bacterium]|nr:hypothetical protein [Eubacteriales bacterium]
SACTEGSVPAPDATPVQIQTVAASPTPAPTPARIIAVFGAEDAEAFLAGVRSAAEADGSGVEIRPVNGGISALSDDSALDVSAAIVFLSGEQAALPKTALPIYVFAADGQTVSADNPHLTYNAAAAPKLALDSALSYPPHLAPVRMIGLFSSPNSPAYLLWSDGKANGTIFAKQEFFGDTAEVSLADWLNETLPPYYPGMLDAIYAESGALAVSAAESLASLGRDDIEVFSASSDADAATKISPILVCAVGENLADAGTRCYGEALKLLSGNAAQSGELSPEAFLYSKNP